MKQVVFVSGKGGTGKTSVTAAISALAPSPKVMADLDVDAANLSIVLQGDVEKEMPFMGQPKAAIDFAQCTGCGQCISACVFNALQMVDDVPIVNTMSCEGCHACALMCSEGAISFVPHQAGVIRVQPVGEADVLVHAELGVAEDNSGKLVAEVRKAAKEQAEKRTAPVIFLDGPPGIGCPVHASLNNVHLAVIVTEPSTSGVSDFERILELCGHFSLPVAVIINKSDLAPALTGQIIARCETNDIPVLGSIAFSRGIPKALADGNTLLSVPEVAPVVEKIYERIQGILGHAQ